MSADRGDLDCGQNCTETYSLGDLVTLTATPGLSSEFAVWTGDCSGTSPVVQIPLSQDTICTANFNRDNDDDDSSSDSSGDDDDGGDDDDDDGGDVSPQ